MIDDEKQTIGFPETRFRKATIGKTCIMISQGGGGEISINK